VTARDDLRAAVASWRAVPFKSGESLIVGERIATAAEAILAELDAAPPQPSAREVLEKADNGALETKETR
jgi:F420-0:gamma-glutamyl ligase